MEYQTYIPWPLNVGDDVCIEGITWFCLEPCRLIGTTIDHGVPVIDIDGEAELSTTQMIKATDCPARPSSGLVRTANTTLMQFEQIDPDGLAGKQIQAVDFSKGEIIIITTEKQYVKLVNDYEDGLVDEVLTMEDLWSMKLISAQTWGNYLGEFQKRGEEHRLALAVTRFKEAAAQVGLGIEIVKELLDKPK